MIIYFVWGNEMRIPVFFLFNILFGRESGPNRKITFCEYHSDCEVGKICCSSSIINWCCTPPKLVYAPVPVSAPTTKYYES